MDEEELENKARIEMSVKVRMWEFGQNDPKRDSGSKLCRLGYAKALKIGQKFNGVVLSSEGRLFLSPQDRDLVLQNGVAGINCSWNRLEEIPFHNLGKMKNHRKLPLIFAANTVNYGKAYKMNTAEALAAALYITGFKADAEALLYPLSYGQEFLRLNYESLEAFSACTTEKEVADLTNFYLNSMAEEQQQKQSKKEANKIQGGNIGNYIDESLLPPRDSEDEYEYGEYEEREYENGEEEKV